MVIFAYKGIKSFKNSCSYLGKESISNTSKSSTGLDKKTKVLKEITILRPTENILATEKDISNEVYTSLFKKIFWVHTYIIVLPLQKPW